MEIKKNPPVDSLYSDFLTSLGFPGNSLLLSDYLKISHFSRISWDFLTSLGFPLRIPGKKQF